MSIHYYYQLFFVIIFLVIVDVVKLRSSHQKDDFGLSIKKGDSLLKLKRKRERENLQKKKKSKVYCLKSVLKADESPVSERKKKI